MATLEWHDECLVVLGWMATLESREVREKIGYASRFVRVILAQGPC